MKRRQTKVGDLNFNAEDYAKTLGIVADNSFHTDSEDEGEKPVVNLEK